MLPDAEGKVYLDQVKSVLPGLLSANAAIKADFDALSAAAQRLKLTICAAFMKAIVKKVWTRSRPWSSASLPLRFWSGISLNFINVIGRYLFGYALERRRRDRNLYPDLDRVSGRRGRDLARISICAWTC